jgi:putative membrane protein
MHWGWGRDMTGWGGGLFMIIFWVVIIVGIALLVKWLSASSGKDTGSSAKESPMEILKRRYAAGEIGKEEFEEKKKDLQG